MTELLGLEPAFSEICLFLFVFFLFCSTGCVDPMNPIGKQRIEGRLDACVPDSPGCPPYRYYLSIVCEYHKLLP